MMRMIISCAIAFFSLNALAITYNVQQTRPDGITLSFDAKFPSPPFLDILFVIDDSGSMVLYQQKLSAIAPHFLNILEQQSDFHMGVISATLRSSENKFGKLVGDPTYLTKSTPQLESKFKDRLLVGTTGYFEESVFAPVKEALMSPLATGYNAGFLREGAPLSLVFVTDAADQSDLDPFEFAFDLYNLKGRDLNQLTVSSIIIPEGKDGPNCRRNSFNDLPHNIILFTNLLGGKVYNLCDFVSDDLKDIAHRSLTHVNKNDYKPQVDLSAIELLGKPYASSIQVVFGNQIIDKGPEGWSYDDATNILSISEDIPWQFQPKGTLIEISYQMKAQ